MNFAPTNRKEVMRWINEIRACMDDKPFVMINMIAMSVPVDIPGENYDNEWIDGSKELLIHELKKIVVEYGKKRLHRAFTNDMGKNKVVSEDWMIKNIFTLIF